MSTDKSFRINAAISHKNVWISWWLYSEAHRWCQIRLTAANERGLRTCSSLTILPSVFVILPSSSPLTLQIPPKPQSLLDVSLGCVFLPSSFHYVDVSLRARAPAVCVCYIPFLFRIFFCWFVSQREWRGHQSLSLSVAHLKDGILLPLTPPPVWILKLTQYINLRRARAPVGNLTQIYVYTFTNEECAGAPSLLIPAGRPVHRRRSAGLALVQLLFRWMIKVTAQPGLSTQRSYLKKNGGAVIFWCIACRPACKAEVRAFTDTGASLQSLLEVAALPSGKARNAFCFQCRRSGGEATAGGETKLRKVLFYANEWRQCRSHALLIYTDA